ncbi:hypothetical protein AYI68_g6741, partial [Smittium mucronatum]
MEGKNILEDLRDLIKKGERNNSGGIDEE